MKLKKFILDNQNSLILFNIYFFSLVFLYSSNIVNYFFFIKEISLFIVFIFSCLCLFKIVKKKEFVSKIIKKNKFILSTLLFFILIYFYFSYYDQNSGFSIFLNLNEDILIKQSCTNIPSFICHSWYFIYFIFLILIFFAFQLLENINFSKIFIYTALIFAIIGIGYFLFILILSMSNVKLYLELQHYLMFGNETVRVFPHFSITYTPSSRNYEIFPIIIGKLYLINEIYKNERFNKYNILLFIFLSIFIFFSYSRLIWILDGFIMLLSFILVRDKKKFYKLITINLFAVIIFIGIFSYIYNYSKILKWDWNNNYRTNIVYYTMAKISTLFSKDLERYFYEKNYQMWFYYAGTQKNRDIIVKDEFKNNDSKSEFFKKNIEKTLEGNFNSNAQRKNIYKTSLSKFLSNPFGYGVGKIPIRGSNAESGFLQIALETGFIGLLLFITLLIYPIFYCYRKKDNDLKIILIMSALFLLSQLLTVYFWYSFFWFFIGFIYSIISSSSFVIRK